ncbi:MAG: hypothetical protein V4627_11550 [Pseudomonadota bacterium]
MTLVANRRKTVAAVLACCASVGVAHAQDAATEKLKLRAGLTQVHDSNFQRAIDAKAASDFINTQTLDVNVALPYGQQRLELEANLASNKHQTFTQFDYTGHNYNAAWRWSLTPTLMGVLSTKRTETLNSAADSLDPSLRNTNVTKIDNLNAGYLLGGPWQLFADYSKGSSTNERALLGITDANFQSYTAGVSYAPSAGNSLNYARRADTGTSTGNYSYNGHAFVVAYAPTTSTTLKARLAYLEQRFSVDPKFDFSGITGGLEGTWNVTPKTSFNGSWLRDITAFQTVDSTHARTDTFSISPKWLMRPTLSIGLAYRQAVRDALGSPNGTTSTRQDRTQETSWNLNWQPRAYVNLRATVSKASRASNVIDQDFTAQLVSFGAQFIY